MYEIDEVTDFVDGGRKQLKVSPRANPVLVYGGTWKLLLDKGLSRLAEVLMDGSISAKDLGLFFFLVEVMGTGNRIDLAQTQIAALLGMPQGNVSRSWKKLKGAGLVAKDMINPEVITKGRTEDYETVLGRWKMITESGAKLAFGQTQTGGKNDE